MIDKVLDELITIYKKTKKECVEEELFYRRLKDNLNEKMEEYVERNVVLKQYKMSCISYLDSKVIELNFSGAALLLSIGTLFFTVFKAIKVNDMIWTIIAGGVLGSIFLILLLAIHEHNREKKIRDIFYVISDIESEKNNQ